MSTAVPPTEEIVPPAPAVCALLITRVPASLANRPVPLTLVTLSVLKVVVPVLLASETPGLVAALETVTAPVKVVLTDELPIEMPDALEPISLVMLVVPVTATVPAELAMAKPVPSR
jgi:hypothetical protein